MSIVYDISIICINLATCFAEKCDEARGYAPEQSELSFRYL
jgi:hypothetical protein